MRLKNTLPAGRNRNLALFGFESLESRNLMSGGVPGVPLITVDATGGAQNAAVAMTPAGGYVLAWTDTTGIDGSGDGIMARLYGANGVATGSAFVVNVGTTGNQVDPSVAVSPDGTIAIAWTDTNLNQISARRLPTAAHQSAKMMFI